MQEKISMTKTKEILRLRYEHELSVRDIGLSCHIGRQTVANYLALARLSNINWAEDKNLSDVELEAKLYKRNVSQSKSSAINKKPLPDFAYIKTELKKRGVTLQLLWSEYKREFPDDGYQYEMFCLLFNRWEKKLKMCMRQNHKAGEKLFIDYEDGLSIINSQTGEVVSTELFVAVWGASNYTYAEATMTQQLSNWIMSNVRAFEYFGCVPHVCVPDNLKSGVTKACRYEPDINQTYLNLAQHYKTVVIPARPKKPKDKAKVEVGVQIAARWILAVLRNHKFFSLGELNGAIKELLEKLNTRLLVKFQKSRRELFEELDKPNALMLPGKPYEYAEWKKCRVNIDYHIEVAMHYYSAPYQLRSEQVDVRLSGETVEIFFKGQRITSHVRSMLKGFSTTKKEHMPESHRQYLEWTPSRIIDWAGKNGQNTAELVKMIMENRAYPEQGYRSCLGIMRLTKYYPVERVENACKRALKYKLYSYRHVKNILETKLDQQTEIENKTISSPMHENIRGENYWEALC